MDLAVHETPISDKCVESLLSTTSRKGIVVAPIVVRTTLKRPEMRSAASATSALLSASTASSCSAMADIADIKCDLPVP